MMKKGNNRSNYSQILDEFKNNENPEAILVVGEDALMTRLVLAWPNVARTEVEPPEPLSKDWDDVKRWDWLWSGIRYAKKDISSIVGRNRLDVQLRVLIANRILYPDGTIHSYLTKFLRTRVIKLLEKKIPARRVASAV
jgi:hypothetical protein